MTRNFSLIQRWQKKRLPGGRAIAETLIFALTSVKSAPTLGLTERFRAKMDESRGLKKTSVKMPFLALAQQGFQTVLLTAHLRADLLKTF